METVVKHFNELTTAELADIYRLRVAVFVVEQNCPYQEIDGWDGAAYHVYFIDENGIQAYLRVLPVDTKFPDVSLGRVISQKRRCGLGSKLLTEGIRVAREKFHAERIMVEAQTYAKKFYEHSGFIQCSEEFLEDGIPHIDMIYTF